MTTKTRNIIEWSLTGAVGLLFIGSALSKFFASEETIQMTKSIGLDPGAFKMIGVVELISALLFIFPRTGIIGTLLLAAYMGGAMATHLTHGQPILVPAIIEALVWGVAMFRFPELLARLIPSEK
ncbi:MAG: DoxX family protein [Bacteroidetes bacterium]|nr:DoxX family protein [Bacteroidota bacterium]MBK8145067.1 DoxX family protein [Bacteroidota bacterium]MBP6316450.1 DoxX family protein [Chitinophagaceae bacterium]